MLRIIIVKILAQSSALSLSGSVNNGNMHNIYCTGATMGQSHALSQSLITRASI